MLFSFHTFKRISTLFSRHFAISSRRTRSLGAFGAKSESPPLSQDLKRLHAPTRDLRLLSSIYTGEDLPPPVLQSTAALGRRFATYLRKALRSTVYSPRIFRCWVEMSMYGADGCGAGKAGPVLDDTPWRGLTHTPHQSLCGGCSALRRTPRRGTCDAMCATWGGGRGAGDTSCAILNTKQRDMPKPWDSPGHGLLRGDVTLIRPFSCTQALQAPPLPCRRQECQSCAAESVDGLLIGEDRRWRRHGRRRFVTASLLAAVGQARIPARRHEGGDRKR